MDRRVQRLHAAAEHLGEPGDVGDLGDLDAGLAQRRRGAAAGDELRRRARRSARASVDDARLVVDRQQRAADLRRAHAVPPGYERCRPSTTSRSSSNARTARGSSRCSTSWIRGLERVPVVVVADLDRLLQHDRAGVDALVDEVHRDAGHLHAVRQGVAHAVHARERRQQRRVHVQPSVDASARRPAGRGPACSRRSRSGRCPARPRRVRDRRGQRGSVAGRARSRASRRRRRPLARSARTPGRSDSDERDMRADRRVVEERLQVRARARDQHRDTPAHGGAPC